MGKTFRNTPYGMVTKEGINPARFNEQGASGPQLYLTRRAAIAASKARDKQRIHKQEAQTLSFVPSAHPEDEVYEMN